MFVKVAKRTKKWKTYKTVFLAEWYRDKETWKVKHRHHCSLKWLSEEQILWLKQVFGKWEKDVKIKTSSITDLKFLSSKQYGQSLIFGKIFDECIWDSIWRKYKEIAKTTIINRIFEPKSKDWLWNWLEQVDWFNPILSKKMPYNLMDYFDKQKDEIEKKLFEKNKDENCDLLLYDITSTYFEWDKCEIAKYWYSRDHRWDKKQVNIWLVTNSIWCPITTEVIEWNLTDKTTVQKKVDSLKTKFGIKNITFVFDRWMKTKVNLEYIQEQWFEYITALNHSELKKRAEENKDIQKSLFEKENLAEFIINDKIYILSYNQKKAYKDTEDRKLLIEKTEKHLEKIQKLKRDYTVEQLQDKISKKINKYKCERYVDYEIKKVSKTIEERPKQKDWRKEKILVKKEFWELIFVRNQKKIEYDWFYMVESTDTKERWEVLEKRYKSLQYVENAFDSVKNLIDIRPVFHRKTSRVKWHIFMCFLSYYLLHKFKVKVQRLLSTSTLDTVLTAVKTICRWYFEIENITISKITETSELQKSIMNYCWV